MNNIFLEKKRLQIFCHVHDIRGPQFARGYAKLDALFLRFFRTQAEKFAEESKKEIPLKKSLSWENLLEEIGRNFHEEIKKALEEIFSEAAKSERAERKKELEALKIDDETFFIGTPQADAYANRRAGELISGVNETTKAAFRRLFSESWKAGDSLEEMGAKIAEKFRNFGSYRSALIAFQETAMAYETGRAEQFAMTAKGVGVVGYKCSKTQADDSVRESHRANSLEGWIPNNALFSATQTMQAPHGFRCRCVTLRRLFLPEGEENARAFDSNMESLALRGNIDMSDVKASKNPYIQTLNTLSILNAKIPWKRDGKSNPLKKEIYELKNEIILNFVEKIEKWEIKGKYVLTYDKKAKMPLVVLSLYGKRKSFHTNTETRNKIKSIQ